jgi:prepilin-type N-terminal cleavage/methylation domain-containing protein
LRRLRDDNGFTLIELIVSLPMLLILLLGLTTVMIQLTRSSTKTQAQAALQSDAREALSVLAGDIRQGFMGDGSDPIMAASATSITFGSPDRYPTATVGTSVSSFHLRRITYTLSNGILQRQSTASTNTFPTAPPWTWPAQNGAVTTVMGSITNTDVFSYYTESGAQTTPPTPLAFPITDTSGVRAVGIKLTLSTGGSQAKTFTFTQTVALRETDS